MIGVIPVFSQVGGDEALEFIAEVAVVPGFLAEVLEDVVDGLFRHADWRAS
jgi:hypothetical protein